jgi:hypothetical protein
MNHGAKNTKKEALRENSPNASKSKCFRRKAYE